MGMEVFIMMVKDTSRKTPSLKPCPFCGTPPGLSRFNLSTRGTHFLAKYAILCNNCKMATTKDYETEFDIDFDGKVTFYENGAEKAIKAWNGRTNRE